VANLIDVNDRRFAVRQLHAQALATFGATASQHQTTALGSHTGTKTMNAFAMQIAGLICALHR
jgi:hypothetical protein